MLEIECKEKLLSIHLRGNWAKPLTAYEILELGRRTLEPLFHAPPLGPIPDYLSPHWSVHGCVAEYEEKLEELDRWKAHQLNRWLKARIGTKWHVSGKVYELQGEQEKESGSEKFHFQQVEAGPECGKVMTEQS